MNIQKSNLTNGVAFSGHSKSLDKKGEIQHNFYYLYDPDKYRCEVELYNIDEDENGNISIIDDDGPAYKENVPSGGINITIPKDIYTNKRLGFAYRFKLTERQNFNKVSYAFDNGDVIGINSNQEKNNKFNIVFSNRATINKNGPMQLIMPDEYYPGVEKVRDNNGNVVKKFNGAPELTVNDGLRAKALASVRTHANKLGGNFDGIMKRLPDIKKEGISRIVGMPYTKDTVSSHLYWTENAFQVAPNLGTEEDFKELQRQLFANGINWIADAALVNEGLGGIHLNAVLRNGQTSYAQNMFRGSEQKALGILPARTDNKDDITTQHTKMKIMNAPFIIENSKMKSNPNYNDKKATYIQFYDDRLASKAQIDSESPAVMKTYENRNAETIYDITKHDDAVYPFALEVDPDDLTRNVKRVLDSDAKINSTHEIPYENITNITNFSNFKVVEKGPAGGIELWDGNVDIAKLNFFLNPADYGNLSLDEIENFERGTLAVKDYAINSGRYWTQLTSDTQLEYIADNLSKGSIGVEGYKMSIENLVKNGSFPAEALNIDEDILQNVLDGSYHLRKMKDADSRSELNPEYNSKTKNEYQTEDYILKKALDTPLETLPVESNLMSILTSPYVVQKPINEDELGLSRYDLTKIREEEPDVKYDKTTSQFSKIYENEITPIIKSLVRDIKYKDEEGNNHGITDENGKVTEFGRYVLSEITPDLTRYILTKALSNDAEISVSEDGHFDFSTVNEENITMQLLGVKYNSGKTEQEEAQIVIDGIKKGIDKNITAEDFVKLKEKIESRFKSRTLDDYRVAEMIHDRTESGLGWRIDAAKDVASIDAVRSETDTIENAWDNVIKFWKVYNQTVLKENPHAYTTAEITDLGNFIVNNPDEKYMSPADAEKKFLEQTGITSVANYNYFFSLLPSLFTKYNFESGAPTGAQNEQSHEIRNKLSVGWEWAGDNNPGFLFESPEDGVINSYTFTGNHDKPRVLHGLAMDMNLFHHGYLSKLDREKIQAEIDELYTKPQNDDRDWNISEKENKLKNDEALKVRTANVLMMPKSNVDFDKLDSKAIAMAERIQQALDAVVLNDAELNSLLKSATIDLANGKYKGKIFPAEAFGTRPFETAIKTVLDQAEFKQGHEISNRADIEAELLQNIMEPAFDRFLSIYKLLITLPGSPTDFAGDRMGLTGYESKAKNYHQQNRNVIPWEYLKEGNENKYKFIKDFYGKMNEISNLRNRKELSALNNGATVTLPIEEISDDGKLVTSNKLQAMLRYNDEDSVVITLHNNKGASSDNTEFLDRDRVDSGEKVYDRILLNSTKATEKEGLKHGLKVGTRFKNIQNGDEYEIKKFNVQEKEFYSLEPVITVNSVGSHKKPFKITAEELNTMILYKIN